MRIYTFPNQSADETLSFIEYWKEAAADKKRAKDFVIYALIALFPLATTLFAVSLGIVTYRYEKGFVYFGVFGVLFAYFTFIALLTIKTLAFAPVVFTVVLLGSVLYYKNKIAKRY